MRRVGLTGVLEIAILSLCLVAACSGDTIHNVVAPDGSGAGAGGAGATSGSGGSRPDGSGTGGTGATSSGGMDGTGSGGASGSGTGGAGGSGTGGASGGGASGSGTGGASGGGTGGASDAGTDGSVGTGGGDSGGRRPRCFTRTGNVYAVGGTPMYGWGTPEETRVSLLLRERALRDYALAVDQYVLPDASSPHASLETGIGSPRIPEQLAAALERNPNQVLAVIMEGGYHDIFSVDRSRFPGENVSACQAVGSSQLPVCQEIVRLVVETATNLFVTAAAGGVEDIVYFFYPDLRSGTTYYSEIFDYMRPRIQAACDGAFAATAGSLRCHFIDTRPAFDGHPEYLRGIQVLPPGANAIADLVWAKMKSECIGQPQVSGCCDP